MELSILYKMRARKKRRRTITGNSPTTQSPTKTRERKGTTHNLQGPGVEHDDRKFDDFVVKLKRLVCHTRSLNVKHQIVVKRLVPESLVHLLVRLQ